MTELLARLFGRLPIGWLQLTHNKVRFAAALAGVAFANILVFMQLGFLGSLITSISLPYAQMNADIFVSASDMNTLSDGSPMPRQRMFEALAVPGVKSATPLYFGKIEWKQPDGSIRTLDTFGIDPAVVTFNNPVINAALDELKISDRALVDRGTRNASPAAFRQIEQGKPYTFESKGRTLTVTGTFRMGGGFAADGYLVVSDQTFLRLFPSRAAGAPNYILLKVEPGASIADVTKALQEKLPRYDTIVRTVAEAVAKDQSFQTTQRPVGLVFGFGIVIGILVGMIIVYQVLSTDVADHIREYATFKAIGYPQRFFLSVVFEEALVLAVLGFIPGFIIAVGLYAVVANVASLPVSMTAMRAIGVFIATLAMCTISGAIATRRLAKADPADLF